MRGLIRIACAMLLGCLCPMVPASAQSADLPVGTVAIAAAALAMHASAPQWWSWSLPEETGKLEANQPVEVLNKISHNTLLGQDKWFLVRKICEGDQAGANDSDRCKEKTGWVLGSDNGQSLLTPTPPK